MLWSWIFPNGHLDKYQCRPYIFCQFGQKKKRNLRPLITDKGNVSKYVVKYEGIHFDHYVLVCLSQSAFGCISVLSPEHLA